MKSLMKNEEISVNEERRPYGQFVIEMLLFLCQGVKSPHVEAQI